MPLEKFVTKGIVLRETDTKEADKILTVLTPDRGRISVIARGARRRGSKIAAASQTLVYSEMVLCLQKNWYILDEASTEEQFLGLRQDISLLSLGAYFAEMSEALTQEDVPSGEVLSLLLNALYALAVLKKEPALVKAGFELRLMCLSGYEPLIDECARCGVGDPTFPMLDAVQGVLFCRDCSKAGTLAMPLCESSLAAMRHIVYAHPKKLYSFSLHEDALLRLSQASEAFCAAQLERGFATLDFYKSLQSQ